MNKFSIYTKLSFFMLLLFLKGDTYGWKKEKG